MEQLPHYTGDVKFQEVLVIAVIYLWSIHNNGLFKGIMMYTFEHNFEEKTFRLTIMPSEFNCNLGFEIFDNEKLYLDVKELPVYKKRLLELSQNFKVPEPGNEIGTFNFLPHFNFGHQNKSYLLFNIQMIMDHGILIGCLYAKDNSRANHFTITGISGRELSEFIENTLIADLYRPVFTGDL